MPRAIVRPLQSFLHTEAAGGVVLFAATLAALAWANVDSTGYASFWDEEISVGVGDRQVASSLSHAVNDGLMALFFLVIGLEVKRELSTGELVDRRAAILPFAAAVGGMVVPALLFVALSGGGDAASGWGIPMATDIAFALGVLALLGRRIAPEPLVLFLLTVAVVDDIGAILVIAVVYSSGISIAWLAAAGAGLVGIVLLERAHVRHLGPYVLLGLVVWAATLQSGVHATIAGVAIGLLAPAHPFQRPDAVSVAAHVIADETADEPNPGDERAWRELSWLAREAIAPLNRLEHALHPWTSFMVLPLFALANAGIVLDRDAVGAAVDSPVTVAVIVGLVVGKTLGVLAGAGVARALGASLPPQIGWLQVAGVGALAGIGFTVSLFITELAYDAEGAIDAAKVGILAGSVLAGLVGAAILAAARPRRRPAPRSEDSSAGAA